MYKTDVIRIIPSGEDLRPNYNSVPRQGSVWAAITKLYCVNTAYWWNLPVNPSGILCTKLVVLSGKCITGKDEYLKGMWSAFLRSKSTSKVPQKDSITDYFAREKTGSFAVNFAGFLGDDIRLCCSDFDRIYRFLCFIVDEMVGKRSRCNIIT